jgi:hypothetical protein
MSEAICGTERAAEDDPAYRFAHAGYEIAAMDDFTARNHNQGPPLDDDEGPEWGDGDAYIYFNWKAAHRQAWKPASRDMALFRLEKAEALGLTYEEYTLEILERGRYLQRTDTARIDAIKRRRDV